MVLQTTIRALYYMSIFSLVALTRLICERQLVVMSGDDSGEDGGAGGSEDGDGGRKDGGEDGGGEDGGGDGGEDGDGGAEDGGGFGDDSCGDSNTGPDGKEENDIHRFLDLGCPRHESYRLAPEGISKLGTKFRYEDSS